MVKEKEKPSSEIKTEEVVKLEVSCEDMQQVIGAIKDLTHEIIELGKRVKALEEAWEKTRKSGRF